MYFQRGSILGSNYLEEGRLISIDAVGNFPISGTQDCVIILCLHYRDLFGLFSSSQQKWSRNVNHPPILAILNNFGIHL